MESMLICQPRSSFLPICFRFILRVNLYDWIYISLIHTNDTLFYDNLHIFDDYIVNLNVLYSYLIVYFSKSRGYLKKSL